MINAKYENAIITDTFEEITARCKGDYEKTELYLDIIQRQIEKMFISSSIDEEYERVRQEYRLYPVMLLYKVLIELGRSTGNYSISMTEYRYLVATTKKFENFLDTLLLITLLRKESNIVSEFEQYRSKFDNRLIQALKQLPTLKVERDSISLNPDMIKEVAHKVFIFEENPNIFATENYLDFLGSTKSLFELETFEEERLNDFDKVERIEGGSNILLYGVPGSGKSWTIEHEYCKKDSNVERLVFHPDYTYSDFVGQILPNVSEDGQVSYKFTPGPFTTILGDAYVNPQKEYILIIEEINRGNAPAIFGDLFQLLDRKVRINEDDDGFPIGTSEFGITNKNIALEVYGDASHKVRIPSNLTIIGTMNTSDQNVFTLDTAFQRRWEMRMIENSFDKVDPKFANAEILDTTVTWKNFCVAINDIIVGNNAMMTSAEDKRLGAYFVHLSDLEYDDAAEDRMEGEYDNLCKKEKEGTLTSDEIKRLEEIRTAMKHNRRFPEKVIKYLWDDAFKFSREVIFETSEYQSLEAVIRKFMQAKKFERFVIFKDNVRGAFMNQNNNEQNY
ncbi:hypothetical protein E4100_00280 [Soehngenia longivitae]|uniref:ATPase dynein-related AAA domain-containing protein n=2 Tax=Soehngenia longivitae TaxID=2562294 RepID=A0A4Z0DAB1_9FIRM|nr:hypothetical protein E4100_00280 [Soehngenia longivitae]